MFQPQISAPATLAHVQLCTAALSQPRLPPPIHFDVRLAPRAAVNFEMFLRSLLLLSVCPFAIGQEPIAPSPISITRSNGGSEVDIVLNLLEAAPAYKGNAGEETIHMCLGVQNLRITCTSHLPTPDLLPPPYENERQLYLYRNGELINETEGSSIAIRETNDRNLTTRNFYCYAGFKDGQRRAYYSKMIKIVYFDCSTPIDSQVTKVNVTLDGSASLNCWTDDLGSSQAAPKFEWIFHGVWTEKPRVESTEKTLALAKVSQHDIGSFVCFVWFETINYRYAHKFHLRLSVPLTPIEVRFDWVVRCAQMRWMEDARNRLVQIDPLLNPSYRIVFKEIKKPEQSTSITTDDTKATICNLNSDTDYRVELRAGNKFGESRPIVYNFRTGNGSKSEPSATSYDTQLTVSLGQKLVLPCRKVKLGNESGDHEVADEIENGFGRAIASIKTEDAGFYECKSSGGESSYIMRLSILIPPGPIPEVKCSSLDTQRAMVNWSEPRDNDVGDSLIKQTVESYRVRYRSFYFGYSSDEYGYRRSYGSEDSWREQTVENGRNVTLQDGLRRGYLHLVRITAVNEAGQSPPYSVLCRV